MIAFIYIAIILLMLYTIVVCDTSLHIPSTYRSSNLLSTTRKTTNRRMNVPHLTQKQLKFVSRLRNQKQNHSPSPIKMKPRKSRRHHVQTKDTFMVSVMV